MKKQRPLLPLAFIFVVISLAVTDGVMAQGSTKAKSLRKGEMRATLEPRLFMDPTIRRAYQVAKEIPWVLDSIFCYCYCEDPPFRHKSLLSCYVDDHAVM